MEWIKAKEKLHTKNGYVLAVYPYNVWDPEPPKVLWYSVDSGFEKDFANRQVEYWMPIPSWPKE